ncbi:centrosomal protein of 152 kDa isoform X2 [Salmo trutta]|uniref:Centrosomal protein 152 n=1 Tax=Salmo trutta TaxID=8032 RepID=A0A674EP92_SALTR|nr:centrosomal protein of 152 kDa-like isoform X2 [Salmo trutta]
MGPALVGDMHPMVEDTVEDVRNIQQSLWELHKLLTDLPDDMLEDSRDSSSPELDCSACSNTDTCNRQQQQQPMWNHQQTEWSDHQTPASHEKNYEEVYNHSSYHDENPYEEAAGARQINGHASHTQQRHPPRLQPLVWNQEGQTEYLQEYQWYTRSAGYTYSSVDTEHAAADGPDFSTEEEGYGDELYPRGVVLPGVDYQVVGGQRDEQSYAGGDQNNTREHVQEVVVQCLRDQVRQQERRGEEEQVERAGVINALTQSQQQSQQQCAKLLQTGSVQEMGQLQIKLQQTQSAKTVSDDMNKALQLNTLEEKLRTDLETQHQETVTQLRADLETQHQETLTQLRADLETQHQETVTQLRADLETQHQETVTQLRADLETQHQETVTQLRADLETQHQETVTQLRADLETQHQETVTQLRALWAEEKDKEVRQQVQTQLTKSKARWKEKVEGAVSRAYCRWLQDLSSLPEYKVALQREREKWEKIQEQHVQQQMSLVLTAAEERWQEERPRSSGEVQKVEEMQRCRQLEEHLKTEVEEVAHLQSQVDDLQSQLDREREEKAALLKADMAAARASWSRDEQQEISSLQAFQEEQLKQARDEAQGELELLLQKEAELQQALRDQEEDWRRHEESRDQEHRQAREEVLQELQAGLKEVKTVLLRGGAHKEKENGGEVEGRWRTSGSIKELLMSTCKYLISKAVAQAENEWKKISEEGLGRALKESQERHEKEFNQIHSSTDHKGEKGACGKQCAENVSELQKKSQDLRRHLENACRQLQATVKENKASMQHLKDDHEVALWKEKEHNLQELEKVKRSAAKESSGGSDMEQRLHAGLEQMKEQYMKAVEKIRGDMLRYLQQSKERAAEMIRVEVLRERQDTARKMRRYYLTCLQELLEDGGQATGAEKKIINVASKLAAMSKVLETPTKRTRKKSHSLPGSSLKTEAATDSHPSNASGSASIKTQCPASHLPETTRSGRGEGRTMKTKMDSDLDSKTSSAAVKTTRTTRPMSKPTHQENLTNGKEKGAPANMAGKPHISSGLFLSLPPHKPSHQIGQTFLDCYRGDFTNVTLRTQTSRELYLQGAESGRSDDDNFLCHRSNTKTSLFQELPVRDGRGSRDSSMSSNGSQDGRHILAVNSYPDRKMETETVPSASTFFNR